MAPTEPMAGYVENYLFLVADKHMSNFTRLLDLKGLKKPDQAPLIDVFQRKAADQTQLTNNPNLLPATDSSTLSSSSMASSSSSSSSNNKNSGGIGTGGLPNNITTSLSSMATNAASNFNTTHSPLSPFGRHYSGNASSSSSPSMPSSPTPEGQTKTGRLNENFRKLVMTGMAFRKDLQERRDQYKD